MKTSFVSLIILAAMVSGLLLPSLQVFEPFLIPLLAALIWISSLSISPGAIITAIKKPYKHIMMMLIGFLIVPAIIWGIVSQLALPPAIISGYILVSMGPAAVAIPIYTKILKADTALALAFTGLTLLATPIVIPVMSYLFLHTIITINILLMVKTLVLIILIPLILALFTRKIKNLAKTADKFSLPLLFILLATIIAMNSNAILTTEIWGKLALLAILQPLLSFILAYAVAFSWKKQEQIPFVLGLTVRNLALIMIIAAINFGPTAAIPGAFTVLAHIIAVTFLLPFFERRNKT